MANQKSSGRHAPVATAADVKAILGDLDEDKIIEILALKPTIADLEEAAIWATGDGDVLAKSGRPLAGTVADIVDIIVPEEEEPPPIP
jgi:hypothetical protein